MINYFFFANGCKLFGLIKPINYTYLLQCDINVIEKFSLENYISLNISKYNISYIYRIKETIVYEIYLYLISNSVLPNINNR